MRSVSAAVSPRTGSTAVGGEGNGVASRKSDSPPEVLYDLRRLGTPLRRDLCSTLRGEHRKSPLRPRLSASATSPKRGGMGGEGGFLKGMAQGMQSNYR